MKILKLAICILYFLLSFFMFVNTNTTFFKLDFTFKNPFIVASSLSSFSILIKFSFSINFKLNSLARSLRSHKLKQVSFSCLKVEVKLNLKVWYFKIGLKVSVKRSPSAKDTQIPEKVKISVSVKFFTSAIIGCSCKVRSNSSTTFNIFSWMIPIWRSNNSCFFFSGESSSFSAFIRGSLSFYSIYFNIFI